MPIDDLVEDRAVRSRSEDLLGHAAVADDLAYVLQNISTPANVALYAPWGSGKTGLANLLGQRLDGVDGLRFLRFDAFKYAEAPLRRHFLSQVAKELDIRDEKYSAGLYTETTDTTIQLPARDLSKLALWFV